MSERSKKIRGNLRNMLDAGKTIVVAGAHDPLCAKIAEKVGFEAVYVGSYASSAVRLGRPDYDELTLTEILDSVRNTAAAVNIPVFADGGAGFGGPMNVRRTVSEYEKAGAAAMQLNTKMDAKCPNIGLPYGAQLPVRDYIVKIRAAVEAREDANFLIYPVGLRPEVDTVEDAYQKAKLYAEAGVSFIHVGLHPEGLEKTRPYVERIRKIIPVKCTVSLHNFTSPGPRPTIKELEELGYRVILCSNVDTVYAAAKAEMELYKEYMEKGTVKGFLDRLYPFEELNSIMGTKEIMGLEQQWNAYAEKAASRVKH